MAWALEIFAPPNINLAAIFVFFLLISVNSDYTICHRNFKIYTVIDPSVVYVHMNFVYHCDPYSLFVRHNCFHDVKIY